jgi:hypothetical protein
VWFPLPCVREQCIESWTATVPLTELPHFHFRGAKDCQGPELASELGKAKAEVGWTHLEGHWEEHRALPWGSACAVLCIGVECGRNHRR